MDPTALAEARARAGDVILAELEARRRRGVEIVDPDAFCDLAFAHLAPTGVSWLGFYTVTPEGDSMVLAACRDRPACSPIGLHGVCGQALRSGRTRIVADVAVLGPDYVACDPRDRSEIVVPLDGKGFSLPDGGSAWPARAVLDLDSFETESFSDADDRLLRRCLVAAGLPVTSLGPPLHGAWSD